jgi:hypothetical protein
LCFRQLLVPLGEELLEVGHLPRFRLQIGARSGLRLSCFFGGDRSPASLELLEDLIIDRLSCLLNGITLHLKLGLALRQFGVFTSDLRFILFAGGANKRGGERFGSPSNKTGT